MALIFTPEDIHIMRLNETEEEFDARIEEYVEMEEPEDGLINAIEEERHEETASLFSVPYLLWLLLFVVAPVLMLLYQSFFDISGNFTLDNYGTFFSSWTYLRMSFNSVLYAAIITLVTLLISYPTAYL